MDHLIEDLLERANADQRFEPLDNFRLEMWTCSHAVDGHTATFTSGLQRLNSLNDWFQKEDGKTLSRLPEYKAPCGYKIIGGLRLLVQTNCPIYVDGKGRNFPWKDIPTLREVERVLEIPKTYIMAMDHTSGIAEFTPGTTVAGERKLEFVLHNTDYQSENCSLALSYDTQKNITKGVLSMGPGDRITNLLVHLEKSKHLSIHPMLLPTLLFCKLAEASVSHKNMLKQEIKWLGREIAAVHLREKSKLEDAPGEEMDQINLNRRLNVCLMRQAQRHGRRQFCQQFEEALGLSFIEMETLAKEAKLCDLQRAHQELGRLKAFKTLILKSLEGRDVNYSERIDGLLKLLYEMQTISQARVASAAAKDNSQVKTLTYLGFLFLPANLVAALLSVQAYQLTWRLLGIYFAITIPLVAMVFCIFLSIVQLPKSKKKSKNSADVAGGP